MGTTHDQVSFPGSTVQKIQILYQDSSLLAINKPAGLPTLPDGYDHQAPNLRSSLETDYGRLWIVHRLDRDTSGLLLLARSAEAHRELNMQFEKRKVDKRYHAIVCGVPDWSETTVHLPLLADGDRRHRTVVASRRGKPAKSQLRVLERLGSYSLIEAIPHTGRTHQIRAHLAAIGLPILGDLLYGGQPTLFLSMLKPGFKCGMKTECALIQRTALHANELVITHPTSKEILHLKAPYSKDFNAALRMLHRYPPD